RAERYTRGHVGIQSLPKQIAAARTDAARLKLIDIGIDRIERLNDDYIKRQSLAQIIRVIRKNSPKLRNSIEKQTSGGYGLAQELAKIKRVLLMKPAQVQAELERLNDLLLNNRMYDQAAEQRIDDLIAKQLAGTPLSKGEEYELRSLISDGTIGQLKRLTTYGMLKQASAAEAVQALQALKEMTYQKHLAWIDEIVQERQQRQRERNQMTEIITGGQALLDEEQRQQQQASRQNRWQWWKDQLRGYDDKMQSWEWLLDKLSRYSKSAALDSPLVKTFGRLVTRATRQEQTGIADQVATINLKMAEIFGATKGKLHNIVAANARIKTATGVYRYAGEQQLNEVALSQNQAYKRWMEWQDPTLREQLVSQGYTEQTISEIESFMTPEVRRWAEWQLREFYPGYRPGVNEVFRSLFFTDMPNNPNYSPIKRRYNRGEEDSNLLSRMNPHSSVIAGSVKQRVENSRDIELQDGDTVLMNHVTEMEHFKAWAQPMRQLRGVLGSEQVRDAIDQFHGPVAKQVLNGFMDDFARGKMYQREQSALVQYFRSAFTTAAIGANPVVFVKQLTSFPAFAMDMPAGQWVLGMSYLANPAEVVRAIKTLMSSEMMKDRYRSGFERDMILAMQSTAGQKLSATKNLANRLMILTKLGDGMAIIGGGWPVYKYHYKQQRKAGKSHDEAHAFAIERFDEIAERTQQAGSLKDLNAYQRGGPFAQLFTMFITAPSAYYRQWAGGMRQITGASKKDWVDAARGKNPKLLNGAKRVFITQVVLPTFFALATAAFEWDEDEVLKGILLGPASGLFMLRDIGTALLNAAWGDKNWATGNTPVLSTLEEGVRVITRISKHHDKFFAMDLEELLADEQFLAVIEEGATVAGNLSGLPFGPAIRVGKGAADVISGETTAPVRRAMGFAESRLDIAKKRFDRIARDINATGKSHPAYRAMQRQKALLKRFDARMEKAVSRAERQRIHRERQNSLEALVDEWQ
ncbi:MAG: hypothetical protein RBS34_14300, partial [Desulfofustis sp.]|nr:hypothetical protein [Desulfofustis sp.]